MSTSGKRKRIELSDFVHNNLGLKRPGPVKRPKRINQDDGDEYYDDIVSKGNPLTGIPPISSFSTEAPAVPGTVIAGSAASKKDKEDALLSSDDDEKKKPKTPLITVDFPKRPDVIRPVLEIELDGPDLIFNMPSMTLIVGEPYAGKTAFVRYLCYQTAPYIDDIEAFCPQGEAFIEYDYLDKKIVKKSAADDEGVARVIEEQESARKPNGQCPLKILILEDIVGSSSLDRPVYKRLAAIHGHINMAVFICVQTLPKEIPPAIRNCITHAICFTCEEERVQKIMFASFFNRYFENFKHFQRINNSLPKHVAMWRDKRMKTFHFVKTVDPKTIPPFYLSFAKEDKKTEEDSDYEEEQKKIKEAHDILHLKTIVNDPFVRSPAVKQIMKNLESHNAKIHQK